MESLDIFNIALMFTGAKANPVATRGAGALLNESFNPGDLRSIVGNAKDNLNHTSGVVLGRR